MEGNRSSVGLDPRGEGGRGAQRGAAAIEKRWS
jgi:hypothetical protein